MSTGQPDRPDIAAAYDNLRAALDAAGLDVHSIGVTTGPDPKLYVYTPTHKASAAVTAWASKGGPSPQWQGYAVVVRRIGRVVPA